MFYVRGNTRNTFVKPQRYTSCVLVRNTVCKHDYSWFTRLHSAPLSIVVFVKYFQPNAYLRCNAGVSTSHSDVVAMFCCQIFPVDKRHKHNKSVNIISSHVDVIGVAPTE